MRPDWFRCEKCLWWHEKDYKLFGDQRDDNLKWGLCRNSSNLKFDYVGGDIWYAGHYYCENWTCANCWEKWSCLSDSDETPYACVNHNKCYPVEVED